MSARKITPELEIAINTQIMVAEINELVAAHIAAHEQRKAEPAWLNHIRRKRNG